MQLRLLKYTTMKSSAVLLKIFLISLSIFIWGCSGSVPVCDPDDLVKQKELNCYEVPDSPGLSKWRCKDSAGTITATGMLTDGERNGLWEIIEQNPLYGKIRSAGVYINGYKDGEWRSFYANGVLKSVSNFSNGCRDGYYSDYAENGVLLLKGTYKNGLKDGWWEIFHFNGVLQAKGYYLNDIPEGEWETFYENGVRESVGSYKDGKQSGYWKFWAPNGIQHSEGTYISGKKEGEWTFYETGGTRKVKYVNDQEIR